MEMTEIWVARDNYHTTKAVSLPLCVLQKGQVRLAIDKYGLSANNVSYAVSGDMIGYWQYFPTQEEGWGKVPVWGFAEVIESQCAGIQVGERLYGYLPMSTHLVIEPMHIKDGSLVDGVLHRQSLPEIYNLYSRTSHDLEVLHGMEDERCLFFPLFLTGYGLSDYLQDNAYFEAEQIIIGSASSKTAFSMAAFLRLEMHYQGKIIGLTSPRNIDFVKNLGDCSQILAYGEEEKIDNQLRSVYVDMSGNGPLRAKLHNALQDNMRKSIGVGATHWQAERGGGKMPGAKPEFFFFPSQISKRDALWGRGVLFQKAYGASVKLCARVHDCITVQHLTGTVQAMKIWQAMVANTVAPDKGIIVRL